MKCIPITFSGLFVAAAILVIEMEEVFVARERDDITIFNMHVILPKIASFLVIWSNAVKISFLTAKLSTTALQGRDVYKFAFSTKTYFNTKFWTSERF